MGRGKGKGRGTGKGRQDERYDKYKFTTTLHAEHDCLTLTIAGV